ncbi:hypothetical protein SGRIM128S_02035 [Streptomyces griseomycini]
MWILQAAFVLAVQSGVGAAARRVLLARALTVAAQALVTLLLLTLLFAREHALGPVIPGIRERVLAMRPTGRKPSRRQG